MFVLVIVAVVAFLSLCCATSAPRSGQIRLVPVFVVAILILPRHSTSALTTVFP